MGLVPCKLVLLLGNDASEHNEYLSFFREVKDGVQFLACCCLHGKSKPSGNAAPLAVKAHLELSTEEVCS
jgi:hypothetical protein